MNYHELYKGDCYGSEEIERVLNTTSTCNFPKLFLGHN